jgi:hypothetical protein
LISFAREHLYEMSSEVDELLELHYQELCGNKEVIKLAPRWEQYRALSEAGMFFVFTARAGAELVGYSGFIVTPHLHYGSNVVAVNDVLYLRKDHRLGMTGVRFIKYCEREVAAIGAQKITWGGKPNTNLIPLLERLGYGTEDIIMSKLL